LWTESEVEHHGEFYTIPRSTAEPKPVQRPHPPILLGASALPALRRAGRLADGWVSSSRVDLSRIDESINVVREAAAEAGRDSDALRFVCRGVVRVREAQASPPDGEDYRPGLQGTLEQVRHDIDRLAGTG